MPEYRKVEPGDDGDHRHHIEREGEGFGHGVGYAPAGNLASYKRVRAEVVVREGG